MRRPPLILALLVAFGLPSTLAAQDEEPPPSLRLSFYQCDLSEIGPVMEQAEAIEIPIWDELVDEGMVQSFGYFIHACVGIYTVGESIAAIIEAQEEFGNRFQERHPDAGPGLNAVCPAHRDGFYTIGPGTGQGDEEEGGGRGGS